MFKLLGGSLCIVISLYAYSNPLKQEHLRSVSIEIMLIGMRGCRGFQICCGMGFLKLITLQIWGRTCTNSLDFKGFDSATVWIIYLLWKQKVWLSSMFYSVSVMSPFFLGTHCSLAGELSTSRCLAVCDFVLFLSFPFLHQWNLSWLLIVGPTLHRGSVGEGRGFMPYPHDFPIVAFCKQKVFTHQDMGKFCSVILAAFPEWMMHDF